MRTMSRMMSSKRPSEKGKDGRRRDVVGEEALQSSRRDTSGLASVNERDGTTTDEIVDEGSDPKLLKERLAELEARVFNAEQTLEHALVRAETAERRAHASEQRERNAFYERVWKDKHSKSESGMPRGPRWLASDATNQRGTSAETDTTSERREETWSNEIELAEPSMEPSMGIMEQLNLSHNEPTREVPTVVRTAHAETQTDPVSEIREPTMNRKTSASTQSDASPKEEEEVPKRKIKPFDVFTFGDVAISDVKTEISRARRAARQSDDKERQMIAKLNAYRRLKDQSELRVRELAVELQQVAEDTRVWQTQEKRIENGVADAREASTPRLFRQAQRTSSEVYASDSDVETDDEDTRSEGGGRASSSDHPIFRRIRHGRVAETAELMSASGSGAVNPEARDAFGNTPLIIAAQNNRKRITKLLVKSNCNLDAQNDVGNTSLHYAYAYGHFEVTEYLERRGADVNIKNHWGEVPKDVLRGDPDAAHRCQVAKESSEKRRDALEVKRSKQKLKGTSYQNRNGFESDDGFGTDAEGFDTESDASDDEETPRKNIANDISFEDDFNDTDAGLDSYRALVSGRG